MQNYHIRGIVESQSKYSKIKSGTVKHYDKIYDNDTIPFNTTIRAKSQKEALDNTINWQKTHLIKIMLDKMVKIFSLMTPRQDMIKRCKI